MSLSTGIVAAGSTQAGATPLTARYNYVSTVAAGTGVVLPVNLSAGAEVFVRNAGANALTIYPPLGYAIDNGTVNAPAALGAGATYRFISDGQGGFVRIV